MTSNTHIPSSNNDAFASVVYVPNGDVAALQAGTPHVDTEGNTYAPGVMQLLPANSTTIAPGATGPTVIKPTPGILYGILLTTSAAGIPTAYDNASAASGKVVETTVTNAPVGIIAGMPLNGVNCALGLTILGGGTMPGMTVYWL